MPLSPKEELRLLLNNLFVLTKTDPEKASQVILGLSDLLRYQLYDSAKDKILLSKDIDFIHNLLALEKIRKNDFEYHIKTEGKIDGVALPPFLFIPFGLTWPFILAGFLLFRLFDIWKPYPVDDLQILPGGIGICADDIVAGVYAGICLSLGYAISVFIW